MNASAAVRVLRPGLFTTVQDAGRFGRQSQGIGVGGAMDLDAMRLANVLVGNDESAAVLETTLLGPVLQFETDVVFALTGARSDCRIDGAAVPHERAIFVRAGAEVNVGPCSSGCRTSLAVAGGFAVAPVLGSRSTNTRAHFGGLDGRALAAHDRLLIGSISDAATELVAHLGPNARPWAADSLGFGCDISPQIGLDSSLRVIPTERFAQLDHESRETFFSHSFNVGHRSDRMGYRLEGAPLVLTDRREMISAGVAWGAIQLPPDGAPIVLGADRPTTGGYPVIGHVASADRSVMAQLRPGDRVRFVSTTLAAAQDAWTTNERRIAATVAALQRQRVEVRA